MAVIKNNFNGVDLLATVTELDKRVTALEDKLNAAPEPAPEQPKEAKDGHQDGQPGV